MDPPVLPTPVSREVLFGRERRFSRPFPLGLSVSHSPYGTNKKTGEGGSEFVRVSSSPLFPSPTTFPRILRLPVLRKRDWSSRYHGPHILFHSNKKERDLGGCLTETYVSVNTLRTSSHSLISDRKDRCPTLSLRGLLYYLSFPEFSLSGILTHT